MGAATVTAATVGLETYAFVRTFVDKTNINNSSNFSSLPRMYDREAIRQYWLIRPLHVLGRIGQIVTTLGPVGVRWYAEEHFPHLSLLRRPESSSISSAVDDNNNNGDINRQQYQARQFRQALTHLGPAWVKAGQQLAIRPDLVPPVVLKELSTLCDSVTPINDEIALQVLRDELQIPDLSTVFSNIQLVASASLGQVYQATLVHPRQADDDAPQATTTNEVFNKEVVVVAIKIQRPGMREAFSLDLFLLQQWGEVMDTFTSIFTHQPPYHRAFLDAYSEGSYSVRMIRSMSMILFVCGQGCVSVHGEFYSLTHSFTHSLQYVLEC